MTVSDFSRRSFLCRGTLLALGATSLGHLGEAWADEAPADFSRVPGVVLNHSPAAAKKYVGGPSIAILPDGDLVASHDWFGPGFKKGLITVFRSSDRGRTWRKVGEIHGRSESASSLFVHAGKLYLMGLGPAAVAVIRRSDDGGTTWTSSRTPGGSGGRWRTGRGPAAAGAWGSAR